VHGSNFIATSMFVLRLIPWKILAEEKKKLEPQKETANAGSNNV